MQATNPLFELAKALVGVSAVLALVASLQARAAAQDSGSFPDVAPEAYYAIPVSALAEQGILAGTECEEGFCPGDSIDRKTVAVWIVRHLDGTDPAAVPKTRFEDVATASFYAPFIERLAELGVTSGCGDGSRFCPDRTVRRAEMAVFLSRAFGLPDGPDPAFDDVPPDAWYAFGVAGLAAVGITAGCGDGSGFCPNRETTRAAMATFLYRANTAEVLIRTCPARQEIYAIDEDLELSFVNDMTTHRPLVCTEAQGSADLTEAQWMAYQTLRLMKATDFTEPLPWTDSLYDWFLSAVDGIIYDGNSDFSFCCRGQRIVISTKIHDDGSMPAPIHWYRIRRQLPVAEAGQSLISGIQLLVHEARHAEGPRHTCGDNDCTFEEMGAWAYASTTVWWYGEKFQPPAFFSSSDVEFTRWYAPFLCRRIVRDCPAWIQQDPEGGP